MFRRRRRRLCSRFPTHANRPWLPSPVRRLQSLSPRRLLLRRRFFQRIRRRPHHPSEHDQGELHVMTETTDRLSTSRTRRGAGKAPNRAKALKVKRVE